MLKTAAQSEAQEMDFNNIDLVHIHAVEETLRYVDYHGDKATYQGVISNLSWYWMDHGKEMKHKPQRWLLEWIKSLTGEPV